MSTDMKLSKDQISEIIQSSGSYSSCLGDLSKKTMLNHGVSFARDKLPELVSNIASNAASSAFNKFERRISRKGVVRARKVFTLFISNKDVDDIIKIIKSLEDLVVLLDGVTEKVKHEIRKEEGGFLSVVLAPLAASLVQLVISSVVKKGIAGREVKRAGK